MLAVVLKVLALSSDADKGGGGEGDNGHKNDGVLLSRIVLPSHVLMDGPFARLPPPLALERAAFFKWLVVSCCLINVEGEEGGGGEGEDKENWGRMGRDDRRRRRRRPRARARSVKVHRSTTPRRWPYPDTRKMTKTTWREGGAGRRHCASD